MIYGLSGHEPDFYFLQCRARGANLSLLFVDSAPVAEVRLGGSVENQLPIFTRISYSMDCGVPPVKRPVVAEEGDLSAGVRDAG